MIDFVIDYCIVKNEELGRGQNAHLNALACTCQELFESDDEDEDMANEKKKFIENKEEKSGKKFDEEHAIMKAKKAIEEVANKYN